MDLAERAVWLGDIDGRVDSSMALCGECADRLVVPRGWTRTDLRNPTPRLFVVTEAPADDDRTGTDADANAEAGAPASAPLRPRPRRTPAAVAHPLRLVGPPEPLVEQLSLDEHLPSGEQHPSCGLAERAAAAPKSWMAAAAAR